MSVEGGGPVKEVDQPSVVAGAGGSSGGRPSSGSHAPFPGSPPFWSNVLVRLDKLEQEDERARNGEAALPAHGRPGPTAVPVREPPLLIGTKTRRKGMKINWRVRLKNPVFWARSGGGAAPFWWAWACGGRT